MTFNLPLLPPIPIGDRHTNIKVFRYLGRGQGKDLYECWDEAVFKYATEYAKQAILMDRTLCND